MIVGTLSISIHAPPRGATAGLGLAPLCPWHFNSRPSARGDPSLRPNSATLANYFNSRPSARGDRTKSCGILAAGISIHAPPRGATPSVSPCSSLLIISIHAPPRGATAKLSSSAARRTFQFTPLREGRPGSSTVSPAADIFQFTPLREGRPSPVALQTA